MTDTVQIFKDLAKKFGVSLDIDNSHDCDVFWLGFIDEEGSPLPAGALEAFEAFQHDDVKIAHRSVDNNGFSFFVEMDATEF